LQKNVILEKNNNWPMSHARPARPDGLMGCDVLAHGLSPCFHEMRLIFVGLWPMEVSKIPVVLGHNTAH
jgi:hypothetical protein